MNDSIRLSEKLGVNPHVTKCPGCGKDSGLILTGNTHLYECPCGQQTLGKPLDGNCPKCRNSFHRAKDLGEPTAMHLGQMLCKECEDKIVEEKAKGAVPFRCADCGSEGWLKAESEFAKMMREKHPGHGVQFSKKDCPVCNPQ